MLPDKIRLWKKNDKGRFVFYARVFTITPATTPASIEVQRIARLVQRGWIAYDAEFKSINSKTPVVDFDFVNVDTQAYEQQIQESDPEGHKIGQYFRQFLNRDSRPKYVKVKEDDIYIPDISPEKAKAEHDEVVRKAVEDYKAGKPIPKYLINDVMNTFNFW